MKRQYLATTAALILLSVALTYSITLYAAEKSANEKLGEFNERAQQYAKIAEVQDYIEKYFVNEYDPNKAEEGALYGMVAYLGDKWSYYLNAEQFASYNSSINSKFVGIGINSAYDTDTGGILVFDVYADSPAERAGLQPFDIIIKVDGSQVAEIGYDAAVSKVRGQEGTAVELTIYRESAPAPIDLSIIRQSIQIETVRSKILDNNVGYIKISSFDVNVDKTIIGAIENLLKANVSGIVFDVRNNPGGALTSLVSTLDKLLPEGVIISEKDKNGESREHRSDAEEINIPMAVLVNEYSISAAEFFAASLQENDKAVVVGTRTTGKGVAQIPIPLKDGSGLILSASKYYTAKGVSLSETGGVTPDIEVKLTAEEQRGFYKLTAAQDPQIQAAVNAVLEKLAG